MTFSQSLKEELLVADILPETSKAELIAVFKAIGILEQTANNIVLSIKHSNLKLVKRVYEIIHHEYPRVKLQTSVVSNNKFKKKNKFYTLKALTEVKEMLLDLKLINDSKQTYIFKFNNPLPYFNENNNRAYVKMFFCASGSVNDPQKSRLYHLELTNNNSDYLKEIQKKLKKYEINFKFVKRKHINAIYINRGDEIADFLKYITVTEHLFRYEEYRYFRDLKSMSNRLNNADIANETRKYETSQKQIKAIELLKEKQEFDKLSKKSQEIANFRVNYPEESLQELADKTKGLYSKSNFSYHLQQIVKKAEKL